MMGYRLCVSWFHYWDFIERFPQADESSLVADRLFVIDRRRITCSGGRASIDVAAAILLRHFDASIVQKALRTAAWLLTSSDRTVTEIASSCGFADASHLGREFKKEYGEAPNAFRMHGAQLAQ